MNTGIFSFLKVTLVEGFLNYCGKTGQTTKNAMILSTVHSFITYTYYGREINLRKDWKFILTNYDLHCIQTCQFIQVEVGKPWSTCMKADATHLAQREFGKKLNMVMSMGQFRKSLTARDFYPVIKNNPC